MLLQFIDIQDGYLILYVYISSFMILEIWIFALKFQCNFVKERQKKLSKDVNAAVQLRPFIFTIFIIIFALKEKQNMRNICIRSSLKVMSIARQTQRHFSYRRYTIITSSKEFYVLKKSGDIDVNCFVSCNINKVYSRCQSPKYENGF